jgi:protocatechuate 3,4-dioxygenase beta subunit
MWLTFLEQENTTRNQYLKAYFVYGNEKDYKKESRQNELEEIGKELNLKNIALTFVPSMTDAETEIALNRINPDVENTFIIYRHRTIIDKFVGLKPTTKNFDLISSTLNKTRSAYFDLPEPDHR